MTERTSIKPMTWPNRDRSLKRIERELRTIVIASPCQDSSQKDFVNNEIVSVLDAIRWLWL